MAREDDITVTVRATFSVPIELHETIRRVAEEGKTVLMSNVGSERATIMAISPGIIHEWVAAKSCEVEVESPYATRVSDRNRPGFSRCSNCAYATKRKDVPRYCPSCGWYTPDPPRAA